MEKTWQTTLGLLYLTQANKKLTRVYIVLRTKHRAGHKTRGLKKTRMARPGPDGPSRAFFSNFVCFCGPVRSLLDPGRSRAQIFLLKLNPETRPSNSNSK